MAKVAQVQYNTRTKRSRANDVKSPRQTALYYCKRGTDPKSFVKKWINDHIGYGVFTTLPLKHHQFVLQYPGKVLTRKEGERLELEYPTSCGSFIFFMDKKCVDATNETRLGKYVNHSSHRKYLNCYPKLIEEGGNAFICLFASYDIPLGTELRYNYGISGLEWQKDPTHNIPFNLEDLVSDRLVLSKNLTLVQGKNNLTSDVIAKKKEDNDENVGIITDILKKLLDDVVATQMENMVPDFSDSEDEGLKSSGNMLINLLPFMSMVEDSEEAEDISELDTLNHISSVTVSTPIQTRKLSVQYKASGVQTSIDKDNLEVDFTTDSPSICEISVKNDSGLNVEDDMEIIDTDEEGKVENSIAIEKKETSVKKSANEKVGKSEEKEAKQINSRPLRPCFVCDKKIKHSKLNRHITLCHKHHPDVKDALNMPRKERLRAFANFRKIGIYNHNVKEIEEGGRNLLREKQNDSDDPLVMCTTCKGFYAKTFKARHKADCSKNSCQFPVTIALDCTSDESWKLSDDQFKQRILNIIRDDAVGTLAKSDPVILMVGHRLYGKIKRRLNKKMEVERSVRSDMRRLAHVYSRFKDRVLEVPRDCCNDKNNAGDMFLRENFEVLKYSIESYTHSDLEVQKSGLKAALYYVLKDAAEKLIGYYLGKNNDVDAEKIKNFLVLLKLRKDEIFADATYDLNMRRNVKTKKPAQLPNEGDVQLIRDYVIERIRHLSSDPFIIMDRHTFVELRDCACTRLVLYNGRRGGEPSRLTVTQWIEAEKDEWLDKQRIQDIAKETNLSSGTKITFQSGKGVNHLVPVFIPKDTVAAMKLLANEQVRKDAGVLEENSYIFPSTQGSDNHCSGWHSLDNVCAKLPIANRERISGTSNRHRLSTLIAGLGLSESDMSLAYDHFGHSERINKTIYQAPAAHRQLLSTGKHLSVLDNDENAEKDTSKANTVKLPNKKKMKKSVQVGEKRQTHRNDTFKKEKTCAPTRKYALRKEKNVSQKTSEESKHFTNVNDDEPSEWSESSEDSELENSVKCTGQQERKYIQWSSEQEDKLYKKFARHIKNKKNGWPCSDDLKKFANEEGITVGTVRNKINNERGKIARQAEAKKKKMNIV
ncbi:uncharacterized protein LOC130657627 isoform X3 [Hydractinia symbiolongicarpus]|uniref:uncharacterized protein LOC130622576 isoform X3 n=3 Tax=Hydractinia symbiolongicarpus TaxID=13093 RepID=UPI002549E826|nr:uncharacterized protein LOC130622576 isoform X3 [Hydractinia symbiolongicarpus]XP_057298471.1 uncharacterized protein LOC130629327 isoform X3 [Hydractinia symbiolongicarpus]XP_057308565.1 uncharacterized protein LOC130646919 isoform X3 [Hydractinia symbiolongicarpus]XP_057308768.1 uncharacterized protein LOC130647065 isoform X3 [Hydractinia symbiolongicarpus]XP_057313902.1 uncharacterized protein LOC130655190 isoform X3 [Hydractinia symbiolongicarpus]XP_057316606.1 uncharacterized protein L